MQTLSWSSSKQEYNSLRSSNGLKRVCSCAWGEDCKKAQLIFVLNVAVNGNDPRGGKCIGLNLSGNGARKEKWRNIVLKNLGVKETSVKDLARVPVAPHHWTVGMHEHMKKIGGKGPTTTYLTKEEIDRIGHITDPLGSFTDENGDTKYYMIPNNPKACWESDAKSLLLGSDRADRSSRRTQSAEKEERKRKRKERQKEIEEEKEMRRKLHEVDKLKKPHEWRASMKGLEDTVECQSKALEDKDGTIESLETQLVNARYELQLEKKKTARAKLAAAKDSRTSNNDSLEECDCPKHFLKEVSKLIVEAGD